VSVAPAPEATPTTPTAAVSNALPRNIATPADGKALHETVESDTSTVEASTRPDAAIPKPKTATVFHAPEATTEQLLIAAKAPPRSAIVVLTTVVAVKRTGPVTAPTNIKWVSRIARKRSADDEAFRPRNVTPASPMRQLLVAVNCSPVIDAPVGRKFTPEMTPSHVIGIALRSAMPRLIV
jgi:hypothetical protein